MNIQARHIASKRRIGTTKDGQPVVELLLKGGLVLVTTIKNGKPEVCGAGPHRDVAKMMAEKNCGDDLILDELSKSERITPEGYASVEDRYLELRDHWNVLLSR